MIGYSVWLMYVSTIFIFIVMNSWLTQTRYSRSAIDVFKMQSMIFISSHVIEMDREKMWTSIWNGFQCSQRCELNSISVEELEWIQYHFPNKLSILFESNDALFCMFILWRLRLLQSVNIESENMRNRQIIFASDTHTLRLPPCCKLFQY